MLTALQRLRRLARAQWAEFRGVTPGDRNLYYLKTEIWWAGLATGAIGFNAPFVLKLGGAAELVNLMAALPALMAIVFSIPAARFLESRPNRKPWIVGSLALGRLFFLPIALAPWLLPQPWQAASVVAWTTVQAIPIALFNTGFLAAIGDICPPDMRPRLFAARNIILAGSMALSALLSGLWLERVAFPLNYQILNVVALALSQISTLDISRIRFPAHAAAAIPAGAAPDSAGRQRDPLAWLSRLRTLADEYRGFVNINIATLIGWVGVWAAGPLYTIYFVNTLQLGEVWLGVNATLGQIGLILGSAIWTRIVTRKGAHWTLMRALLLCWLYPILIVLMPWAAPILLFGFVNAVNEAGISITHFSILLDLCPPQQRSSFLAVHITLMNIGATAAPLAAAPLAAAIGVSAVLVGCGAVRLVGSALFWALPPVNREAVRETPVSQAAAET